jgi:hypothetical protein
MANIGWFGNRERHFNNFQYLKNSLANSHYLFFQELINQGHNVYFLGSITSITGKENAVSKYNQLEAKNQKLVKEYKNFLETGECPSFDPYFAISIEDKIKLCDKGWRLFNAFEDLTDKMMDDKYFPEIDLDVIFVDNFFNIGGLKFSCRLNSIMRKYPNATIFIYDETGEYLSSMFDRRVSFKDINRIVVLGTYCKKAKYYDYEVRGVEEFYYCFDKNKILNIVESPELDLQFFGRILLYNQRKAEFDLLFNCSNFWKIQINSDLNLAKECRTIEITKDDEQVIFEKYKKNFDFNDCLLKYPNIKWQFNWTVPCNIYREYNKSLFTIVPVTSHRANYGLISLRPWEAVISGIFAIYTQKFYGWQNFTTEDYIVTSDNTIIDIVKKIKSMDYKTKCQELEKIREKFDRFDTKIMANNFLDLCSKYNDINYKEKVGFEFKKKLNEEEIKNF